MKRELTGLIRRNALAIGLYQALADFFPLSHRKNSKKTGVAAYLAMNVR
ncbi:hypothetical protein [Microbulbifer sp. SA54]